MDQLDSFFASLAFVPMIIRICSPDNLDLFSPRHGFVLLCIWICRRDDLHFKMVTSCLSQIDWSAHITRDRDIFYLLIVPSNVHHRQYCGRSYNDHFLQSHHFFKCCWLDLINTQITNTNNMITTTISTAVATTITSNYAKTLRIGIRCLFKHFFNWILSFWLKWHVAEVESL